jgi:integrase
LISAVYETAIENWGMEQLRNPTRGKDAAGHLVVPSGGVGRDRSKARRLAPDELRAFIDAARTVNELPEVIGIGILTGLRLGQVLALKREWVDVEAMVIKFPDRSRRGRSTRSKNERGQVVPISPAAITVLETLPVGEDGRYFTRDTVTMSVAVYRIRKRLGLPPFSFHTLRHHVNSLLHDAGLSAEERSAALGQRTPAVNVEHYTHVDENRIRAALKRIQSKKANKFPSSSRAEAEKPKRA